jgi:hypothetical protein
MAGGLDSFMRGEDFFFAHFSFSRGVAYSPMISEIWSVFNFCPNSCMVGRTKVDC